MTIRDYCSCDSCGKHYIIRFGLSDQFPQKASFFCSKCGEKLIYRFDIKRNVILENLTKIDEDDTAENINLHPELLMNKAQQSDPYHFATLDFMTKQYKTGDEDFKVMRKMQLSMIAYNKGWDEISKNFRFLTERRFDLVDKKFGLKESDIRKKIVKRSLEISKTFLEGPWKMHYAEAVSELEKARHITAFSDLKTFLIRDIDNFVESLFEVMSDFAKVRSEMLITLVTQKCEHVVTGSSSTVEWDKIEKVYGDLYERYGHLVLILTGINNLNNRGAFDLFNTAGFTFQNYLDSDKANRCKNFENNPKFTIFSKFYEANIRNGTHHKNSKIDKEKQEIILGVGKGGKTEKRMSFVEYISYCNELYAKSLIMLNLIFKVIY
jgi:predicted RNA-binding Zn-ribbon protein involved in translation (DUF1610 family)